MIGKTELDRVLFLISWWLAAIKSHNAIGFFDINKVSEGVALQLLNETYDYQLENLNYEKYNYPGIDLGDKTNKIGFQITSRRDVRKVRKDLGKFVKGPNKIYSNGIRFIILNQEKKPQLNKEKYESICPNFNPERHILNANDLIKEIHRIFDSDREKFYHIKEILEVEIAGKAMKKENLRLLRSKLAKYSEKYYDKLTGPKGRFKHLNISDILDHSKKEWINQQVALEGEKRNLRNIIEALPKLWYKECKHSVILGEGGMGKTVSIVRLWEDYLKKQDKKSPIPIFIALNEYNQVSDSSKREDFIVTMIKRNYGDGTITSEDIWEIMKTPLQKNDAFIPSFILFLDGFNEITLDERELLIEIRRLIEQAQGIQIVITSRYDMRGNLNWTDFNLLRLLELEDKQVGSYLHAQGVSVLEIKTKGSGNRLRQLIKNPMMLTLFASTCGVQKNHIKDKNCDFKERVETAGELMWNFCEAQVAQLPERLGDDKGKQWYYKFLLKLLLPAIGYEMEKAGQFEFSKEELSEFINFYCQRFYDIDFFSAFPEYRRYIKHLNLGKSNNFEDGIERSENIIEIISENLLVMVEEASDFKFLHQNFRDFFAAVHILDEISIALKKDEIPEIIKDAIISKYVIPFIGEIEGEHYCKPFFVEGKGWELNENRASRIYKALEKCRGIFDNSIGNAVWNILETWKKVRGELSGSDLSNLDLSGIIFNGVICNRFFKENYLSTIFTNSLINLKNFFSDFHTGYVNGLVFSPDGRFFFSASVDKEIKKWDIKTGSCILTFKGHTASVNSIKYSPKSRKILTASSDTTIKEWDSETGACVHTYQGHSSEVNMAVYNPEGEKIVSASRDKTIKMWDIKSGDCIKTFVGHSNEVNSAVFSADDLKILSASRDETIKEWDIENENCISEIDEIDGAYYMPNLAVYSNAPGKIIAATMSGLILELDLNTGQILKKFCGHKNEITGLTISQDGKRILSTSWDTRVIEWDIETGVPINFYNGHTDWTYCAVYSPDEKKLISSSSDNTIKEWNVLTGECVDTVNWHSNTVSANAQFNPNGKKVLSSLWDGTIMEWNAETGKCISSYKGHSQPLHTLEYSLDGEKILAVYPEMHIIKEWDVETGRYLREYDIETLRPYSAIYSPDGKAILAYYSDLSVREWSTDSGKLLNEYMYPSAIKDSAFCCNHLAYSPDGKKVMALYSDRIIKEWDRVTGECLGTYGVDLGIKYRSVKYLDKDSNQIFLISTSKVYLFDLNSHEVHLVPFQKEKIDLLLNKNKTSHDGSKSVNCHKERLIIENSNKKIITIPIYGGLFIQGCSFRNLHPNSDLTNEAKSIMTQYGAIF